MRDSNQLLVSSVRYVAGGLIGGTALWGPAHLWLRIPLHDLVAPWLLYLLLAALAAPFFSCSLKTGPATRGDWRPFFVTLGAFLVCGSIFLLHYAARFGLLSESHLPGLYVTAIVVGPPVVAVVYYFRGWILPSRPGRPDSRGTG